MATSSSPSLLDLTVTYDYSTDVNPDDANLPRPTMHQLTQLFPFKDSSKALSSTNNMLSILHELSPAYSAPPAKRAKVRTTIKASETTPPSSSHAPKSKLDILLTQLQQRLSETDQVEHPLPSDATFQSTLPEYGATKLEKYQGARDDRDELSVEKLESLESSDNEETLFWTQAATELEYCENDGDAPPQRDTNEKCRIEESAERNLTFDLNQAWDTEADDFIDQLLITGGEGETISSSPNPLPDSPEKQRNVGALPSTSTFISTQSDVHTLSVCTFTSQATDTVSTTGVRGTDSDRCPTPPLPLPTPSSLSKQQAHNARSTRCKSPRRPPLWRLAQEDTRSTPPLSPLTSEVVSGKVSPLQEAMAPGSLTGLAGVTRGQSSYVKDNSPLLSIANVRTSGTVSSGVPETQGRAQDNVKLSPQSQIHYCADIPEEARRLVVYSRGNMRMPGAAQQEVKGDFQSTPVVIANRNLHQCSQAEIERKRNLARSKLHAKKKASLHNCHRDQ